MIMGHAAKKNVKSLKFYFLSTRKVEISKKITEKISVKFHFSDFCSPSSNVRQLTVKRG